MLSVTQGYTALNDCMIEDNEFEMTENKAAVDII
jgi:hypothetical protein